MEEITDITHPKKSTSYKLLSFLLLSVMISTVLFISPAGRINLVIDMNSKNAGASQGTFSEQDYYSPENGHPAIIQPGRNSLKFPFSIENPTIQWDTVASGDNIIVHDIYFAAWGVKLHSLRVGLKPVNPVSTVKPNGKSGLVIMGNRASNPQLYIDFNEKQVKHIRMVLCGTAGMLIASIIIFLFIKKDTFSIVLDKADRSLTSFAMQRRLDGFKLGELGVLIFIGALFYGYFLSTFSLSIDNEAAALRHNPSVWVSEGRWFTYLIEKFLLQQPSVPFAPYVILIVAFAASYMAILRAHGYKKCWKTYLTYPVFCAFPTWWAIAVFYSNTPALAIGLCLISFSAYLYFGEGFTGNIAIQNSHIKNGLIILMLACAIAAYQSLILMFVTFAFGILLVRYLRNGGLCRIPIKTLAMTLCRLLLLVVMAVVIYEAINKLAQEFIAADSGYIAKNFLNYDKTLTNPLGVLCAIVGEQLAIYGGSAQRYGATLAINGLVICLATLVVISTNLNNVSAKLILWLGVLLSPFALHLVAGGSPLPMRTLIPIAYVSWLACSMLLSAKRSIMLLASIVLVGLLQIKIIGVTSQYIASATIVQAQDRILAADIYSRIGQLSAYFDPGSPLKMDFYGRRNFNTIYANAWQGTMQGSFFSWDEDNIQRITDFMKVMGYQHIVIPRDAERKALNPVFEKMPVWPAAGSVKQVGDTYLIRLSKDPDSTHAL